MAKDFKNIQSFLHLNSQIMGDLHFIYDSVVNVIPDKKNVAKFERIEYSLSDNLNQMIKLYSNLNPFDNIKELETKNNQVISISKQSISDLKYFIKFDYHNNQEFFKQIIAPLRSDMVKPSQRVNQISDIQTVEELVRYMHSKIATPFMKFEYNHNYGFNSHCSILLKEDWLGRRRTLSFHGLNKMLIFSGDKVHSKHVFLEAIIKSFENKRRIRYSIPVNKEKGGIYVPIQLKNHSASITFSEKEGTYNLDYTGSGDYAYDTFRQHFSREFLENFGFKTKECGTYGVEMNLKTTNSKLLDKSVRAIFYLLDNSFDMDIRSSVLEAKESYAHIDGLLNLEDVEKRLKQGETIANQLGDRNNKSDSYFEKIKLIDNPSVLEENILMSMVLSSFPARINGNIIKRDEVLNERPYFYLQNPSALGFAYYHLSHLVGDVISRNDFFEFLVSIDKVQSLCFTYQHHNPNDFSKGWMAPLTPWSEKIKSKMKELVYYNLDQITKKDIIQNKEARHCCFLAHGGGYKRDWKNLELIH